jgi:hypothetical protein
MNDLLECPACGTELNCSGCGEPIENIIAQSSLSMELTRLALEVTAKNAEIAELKTRVAKMNNCFYHWNNYVEASVTGNRKFKEAKE